MYPAAFNMRSKIHTVALKLKFVKAKETQ